MKWRIEFDKKAEKELLRLDKQAQKRILKFLESKILASENPKATGAPLRNNLSGFWRYRIGDYRVICRIEDQRLIVLVVSVGHRKDVYKN